MNKPFQFFAGAKRRPGFTLCISAVVVAILSVSVACVPATPAPPTGTEPPAVEEPTKVEQPTQKQWVEPENFECKGGLDGDDLSCWGFAVKDGNIDRIDVELDLSREEGSTGDLEAKIISPPPEALDALEASVLYNRLVISFEIADPNPSVLSAEDGSTLQLKLMYSAEEWDRAVADGYPHPQLARWDFKGEQGWQGLDTDVDVENRTLTVTIDNWADPAIASGP